jgi:NTE family protein
MPGNVNQIAAAAPTEAAAPVSLALQGGGSLGAFTWGVLDRLLETGRVRFDAVSGASAGAINAAAMASGLATGGPADARETLERFWRRASGAALTPAMSDALAFSSRVLSPYEFNPFDLNPLRLLAREIACDRIRAAPPFRLLIGTTRVRDGSLRIFTERELTAEVLVASACLPLINQAVTIDGEDYWDGGYAANPPLMPLIEASATPRILVVQIIPGGGAGHPRSKKEIVRRLDNITFNASLQHDLETIDLVKSLTPDGDVPNKIADVHIERISAEAAWPDLAGADPFNLDWGFLCGLRDVGREAATAWLARPSQAPSDTDRPSPDAQSAASPSRYVG